MVINLQGQGIGNRNGYSIYWQQKLLKQQKTAFLASSTIPPDMVLKCYDWATTKHEGRVVSGFTEEELDFIINYDIKYRMGDELNEE